MSANPGLKIKLYVPSRKAAVEMVNSTSEHGQSHSYPMKVPGGEGGRAGGGRGLGRLGGRGEGEGAAGGRGEAGGSELGQVLGSEHATQVPPQPSSAPAGLPEHEQLT